MKTEMMNGVVAPARQPETRARWMVVDDNQTVLDTIAAVLEAIGGVEVCRFQSGMDALKAFAAAPGSFDFVVTDLEMPGMSGIELCRVLRALAPRLKVLLATGSGIITGKEAQQFGFCGLLPKPFPVEALRQVVAATTTAY